jgi:hypothetical protein
MFRHVFLYKLAPGADPKMTVEILNALPAKVPGIRAWTLGQHRAPPGASAGRWDYGLVCDFDTFDGLQTYSGHPSHVEAVKKLLPMLSAHAICDFEFDSAKQNV